MERAYYRSERIAELLGIDERTARRLIIWVEPEGAVRTADRAWLIPVEHLDQLRAALEAPPQ